MGFAAFAILIWDHIITFGDEVELIWKGKKSIFTYLFFLNRYLTPLGFIINLYAYLSPVWTPETCQHFVRYEGSMTVIGIEVTAIMMMLRVKAIYNGQIYVMTGVIAVFIATTAVNAWLLTMGQAVYHEASDIHACTMIFDPNLGWVASASAWLPLLYDTIVLGLTFFRTYYPVRHNIGSHLFKRLLADGIIYYSVIFSVTLVLTIMIIVADPGLKNIMAQHELLLTVTMMSRISINLKKEGRSLEDDQVIPVVLQPSATTRRRGTTILHDVELQFMRPGREPEASTADPSGRIRIDTVTVRSLC